MFKTKIVFGLMLVILIAASIGIAEDKPWFDMGNCDFCSKMSPELMANMQYEQYRISNGLMVLTIVKPEYKDECLKALAAMEQLGKDIQEGKVTDVKMCGHCEYYGKMMEAGAKMEHISAGPAEIDLITSDDPEVLKMINIYADNNDKAMAEFEKKEME